MTGVRIILVIVSILAVLFATALVLIATQRKSGMRIGGTNARIVRSDTGAAPPMMVRDAGLGIHGAPDYVLLLDSDASRQLAPLEVKPTRRSRRLFESDRLQLGAYLLGLRSTAGEQASSTGYVRYASATFEVRLTPELEARIREVVAAIREGRSAAVVHRSHSSPARCRGCAVRRVCDESLA